MDYFGAWHHLTDTGYAHFANHKDVSGMKLWSWGRSSVGIVNQTALMMMVPCMLKHSAALWKPSSILTGSILGRFANGVNGGCRYAALRAHLR